MGHDIRLHDDEMICLTDMWKATGSNAKKAPAQWLRTDNAKELMAGLSIKCAKMHVLEQRRGQHGGTWAHWQIALGVSFYELLFIGPSKQTISSASTLSNF
ncbi:KilA-N domain-containing protein [Pseudodesulfovibrio indicus]|uniref:KilA/APSES-type HTH DNA-binding domain-containing protein n=1 Tax=Pseudodesulfovibrio indicus TaxID=1716143 RepID=A0ABM5YYF4_9BACT|nr:KilA-N domain-containing protein [Pseudodesulfovibrio indicus]AMK12467.1 hypothetical protein AWY79_15845 [Pseudodesulfovibrio indicus]